MVKVRSESDRRTAVKLR
ncbi:MAG: hypothetical protein M3299_10350 [Thermoproteota archaeon]|nr:hypothetical protein [Thermoproteota archaeon]